MPAHFNPFAFPPTMMERAQIRAALADPIIISPELHAWARATDFVTGPSGAGKTTAAQRMYGAYDLDYRGMRRACLNLSMSAEAWPELICLEDKYVQPWLNLEKIDATMVLGNASNIWSDQLELSMGNRGLRCTVHPALIRLPWRTITVLYTNEDVMETRVLSPSRENNYGRKPAERIEIAKYTRDILSLFDQPVDCEDGVPLGTKITIIDTSEMTKREVIHRISQATVKRTPEIALSLKSFGDQFGGVAISAAMMADVLR